MYTLEILYRMGNVEHVDCLRFEFIFGFLKIVNVDNVVMYHNLENMVCIKELRYKEIEK